MKIFLDMDGVVANFVQRFIEWFELGHSSGHIGLIPSSMMNWMRRLESPTSLLQRSVKSRAR